MNFNLKDLRWAILTAERGSLRQAAESLRIRQSSLTRCLRGLEGEFGQALFERTWGGTRPTEEGLEFLDVARRILAEAEELDARFKGKRLGHDGRLRIGIHASISTGNLRATLLDFQRRFPGVELRLSDGSSEHLLGELANFVLDIAFIVGNSRPWRGQVLPVWSERVVIAVSEADPLATLSVVPWSALQDAQILLARHGPGSEFYRLIVSRIGDDAAGRIHYHDTALDRLLALVSAGNGVLLALDGATGLTYPGVVFREIHDQDEPVRLHFRACWHPQNNNPTLSSLLGMLHERYPDVTGAAEAD